jgi:polysaccharide export outer membrane protein
MIPHLTNICFNTCRVAMLGGVVVCFGVSSAGQQVPAKQVLVSSASASAEPSNPTRGSRPEKTVPAVSADSAGAPTPNSLVIGPEDVLVIDVWKEPELSRTFPVRPDGKISLPLIGDIAASGLTPKQLQQEISNKLQTYMNDPEVTVIVQEVKSRRFNILGQVLRPGSYQLMPSMTVIDAIALAGGLRDFAKRKAIYVLRRTPDGSETRIPFNYTSAIKGAGPAQNVPLNSLDTIIVP